MKKYIKIALLIFLVGLGTAGFSAVNSVAGLYSPLDNAGASARVLAMGSAFVGLADDSSALFWNPSGLSGIKNTEMSLNHNSWLAGIVQETGVVAVPTKNLGAFALGANYVNYGSMAGYDNSGNKTADYSANSYGLSLGWGKEIAKNISAGFAINGASKNIGANGYSDVSADLGALWSPRKDLKLGVSYSHLGSKMAGYSLASDLRFGGSYNLAISKTNQLLLAAGGVYEQNGVNRLQLGAEDMIHSFLALRIGYNLPLADTEIQGLKSITAGVGIVLKRISVDYAYIPFGDLGTTQRISLGYKFGK